MMVSSVQLSSQTHSTRHGRALRLPVFLFEITLGPRGEFLATFVDARHSVRSPRSSHGTVAQTGKSRSMSAAYPPMARRRNLS